MSGANSNEVDLFGQLIAPKPKYRKNGYSAPPGTGPRGETCKSCKFYISVRIRSGRRFPKCILMYKTWTHSYGTDILARSPACRNWSMKDVVKVQEKIPLNRWDE
jgi:hypothetical protein